MYCGTDIRKNELLIYNSIVKSTVTYGAETRKFNKNFESKLSEEIGEMFKIRKKKIEIMLLGKK